MHKQSRSASPLLAVLGLVMTAGLVFLAFAPATSLKPVNLPKTGASTYMNNAARRILTEVTGIENAKVLPYDFSVPEQPPKAENFIMNRDGKSYYSDSSMDVVCWSEKSSARNSMAYFADVKIKHASQFRRQWSNGDYNAKDYQYPSNMFKSSNGVVGMSADFYKFRKYGIVIQYGNVICDQRATRRLDVLTVDYKGDFRVWYDDELSERIKNEGADDIMLSFTFGPVLVQDGKAVDPSHYSRQVLGELDQVVGRAAIGQLGELHYLLCTVSNPGMTCEDISHVMEEKGCITAYNLDGGQTGTLLFNGKVVNQIAYKGVERAMSDIIYFASAE